MRASAALGRSVRSYQGFAVAMAGGADAAGLAVAIPDEREPAAWAPALAAVRAVFAERSLTPRIEYVDDLHPALAPAAHALGWRTSARLPVMVVEGPEVRGAPVSRSTDTEASRMGSSRGTGAAAATEVRILGADDAALLAFVRGQQRAYRAETPSDDAPGDETAAADAPIDDADTLIWLDLLRQGLRQERLDVVAVALRERLVAGASLMRAGDASELAGVWTSLEVRGRGLGRLACQAALERAFASGDRLVWLSAAPGATRLYTALGFRAVGTQRNLVYPPP